MKSKGNIVIYQTPEHETIVDVRFEKETVWLSQKLMAELFDKDSDTIGLHLRNIFSEGELDEIATTEFFSVVQKEGKRNVRRNIKFYNLDAIISVGYRVNSKRGTQFRIWATNRLKEYLVQGYSINEKRLLQLSESLNNLENIIRQIHKVSESSELNIDEAKGLLNIINNYTRTFVLINKHDSGTLLIENTTHELTYIIEYEEALMAIQKLKKSLIDKKDATDVFGKLLGDSLKGSLENIIQTFDGVYLYSSIEEQAAHLLYFIIKNHPFVDGNKRIGAFLFVWFLEKNKHRFTKKGKLKIDENGLTALALLIAYSHPDHKETMIKLIINMINKFPE